MNMVLTTFFMFFNARSGLLLELLCYLLIYVSFTLNHELLSQMGWERESKEVKNIKLQINNFHFPPQVTFYHLMKYLNNTQK